MNFLLLAAIAATTVELPRDPGMYEEVFNRMEPTRKPVKALEARGAPVELITVGGVTHYQVPGFKKSLEMAARRIEKQWIQ